jgi:hypothetical protein
MGYTPPPSVGDGAPGALLAANNLSDVASAGTSRANLGLVIGTNVLAPNGSAASLTGLPLTTGVSGILPVLNGGTGFNSLVKFSVYKTSDQTVTGGAYAALTWQAEEFDTGNNFASNSFTAPVTGKYLFFVCIYGSSTATQLTISIHVNGTETKRIFRKQITTSGDQYNAASPVMALTAGDVVTAQLFSDNNFTVAGSRTITFFSGFLLSGT